jgi:hypothetical protein
MNRLLCITLVLLLSACTSVPVVVKFPDIPKDMLEACPDLKTIPDTTKLSEVLPVVADNYGQYYACKDNVDNWIDWYKTQSKIFNNIK